MIAFLTLDHGTLGAIEDGLLVGFVSSALAAPFLYRGLLAIKARQTVSEYLPEHQAKQGTPTMGGLIVLVGIVVGWLYFKEVETDVLPFLYLIIGFAAVGLLDDYLVPRFRTGNKGLAWLPKLALQFGVAAPVLWFSGYDTLLLCLGAAVLVVGASNAFNFADGMDGLAGGLAIILFLGLAMLAVLWGAPAKITGICFASAGAILPFLFLNAPPAKLFMGDVGSLSIGAGLGWLALKAHPEAASGSAFAVAWAVPIAVLGLVLAAELIPVPLQILSVKLRKKRFFPMTPIHHAFQSAGWPETRVVSMFLVLQAVAAALAIKVAMDLSPAVWRLPE